MIKRRKENGQRSCVAHVGNNVKESTVQKRRGKRKGREGRRGLCTTQTTLRKIKVN